MEWDAFHVKRVELAGFSWAGVATLSALLEGVSRETGVRVATPFRELNEQILEIAG